MVAAETEEAARNIHPTGFNDANWEKDWASPEQVTVKLLGEALEGTKTGVICASFHAG